MELVIMLAGSLSPMLFTLAYQQTVLKWAPQKIASRNLRNLNIIYYRRQS